MLGPYLLAFIHRYCQCKRHKWIKGNPTVLLATESLPSCWWWMYVFRCWKATWYLKQSQYFRLTWHQWNHSPDCRLGFICLLLAKGWVSGYLVTGQTLHCWLRQKWYFQSAQEFTCQVKIALAPTASLRVFFGFNNRYRQKVWVLRPHVCVLSHRRLTEEKSHSEP